MEPGSIGEKIAAGGTSEVFAWGEGRVLKLFTAAYQYAVDLEAERARAVHEAGLPSPAVFEVVEFDGRRGIVYERVEGPLLLARVESDGIDAVARRLARVHLALHAREVGGLPAQRDLIDQANLAESTRKELLARLEKLPIGNTAYHGDFHPGNVILAWRGPVVIDWVNASRAHPAMDVARSYVLMRYQGLRTDPTGRRARMAETYVEAYLQEGTISRHEYDACLSDSASSLLRAQPGNPYGEELRVLVDRQRPV